MENNLFDFGMSLTDYTISFIGLGEECRSIIKSLQENIKCNWGVGKIIYKHYILNYNPDYNPNPYSYDGSFYLSNLNSKYKDYDLHCDYTCPPFIILYLDSEYIDEFFSNWKFENVFFVLAILPSKIYGIEKRKTAISNLRKLQNIKKVRIFLVDEDRFVDSVDSVLIHFLKTLLHVAIAGNSSNMDFSDFVNLEGFIYYSMIENTIFKNAFDIDSLKKKAGFSVDDSLHQMISYIETSHKRDFGLDDFSYMMEQLKSIKTKHEVVWGFGYKDEEGNDNYTCYAFFSQDKFPEYLEKE